MHLIESSIHQRGQLPLPAAHVIIDIRGISDDQAMEWLEAEIADLSGEMKSREVYHWRNLTEFISFRHIIPSVEHPTAPGQQSPFDEDNDDVISFGLSGRVHASGPGDTLFNEGMRAQESPEDMPFDPFEQEISDLILEIDRVRTNRVAAVQDLNPAAIPGRSRRDATVRVIFLTDLKHPKSLSSAAMYADRLKSHFRKLERQYHQPMLNTVVVCLCNTGEAGPPTTLIEGLSLNNAWEHIDSLILSENYREDAALLSGATQAYIAELMLYVLLIIPPFAVSTPKPQHNANGSTQAVVAQDTEQVLSLPLNTFVVGLAALEYSSRWGRRWLNFGLAKESINLLRQRPENPGKEKVTLADLATSWFKGWRQKVQEQIPEGVPGSEDDVPALEGVRRAQMASQDAKFPFTARHFGFQIGKSTIKDLNDYLDRLKATYVSSGSDLTLHDSLIQSSGQVMQAINKQKRQPEREREKNELIDLQTEAEQVLNHKKFFRGATGAIPRALMQLDALCRAIENFQRDHLHKPLHPQSTRDSLENRKSTLEVHGGDMIKNLKEHFSRWPFLVGQPTSRFITGIVTLILIAFAMGVAIFAGAAWLHHLMFVRFDGLLPFVDTALLGVPVIVFVAVVVALLLLLVELTSVRPALMKKKGSGLPIEITFLATLFAIVLLGWLISFSISTLGNTLEDTLSLHYLAWLAFMPGVAFAAAIIALIVLIIEVVYFFWWLDYLMQERRRIVKELRNQHRRDIQDVVEFIADEVALAMAQQAELIDGRGGPGPYYTRLVNLSRLLDTLAQSTQNQQRLAADRLLYKQGDLQQQFGDKSGKVWLNLHIRDERLEIEPLTDAYKGLRQQLAKEHPLLTDLAEFIVRSEGSESPVDIENELLERQRDILVSNERRLQLFMTLLVAVAMRFAIDPESLRNIDPIDKEYQSITNYTGEEIPAVTSLVKTLNQSMSHVTLENSSNVGQESRFDDPAADSKTLAVSATALWGQFLWLHTDPQLDQRLMTDGILKHLSRQLGKDYDPRAVMRRLLMHTSLFGRSLPADQRTDYYLLLAPTEQSYRFRQGLKGIPLPSIMDFPDVERIMLLGIKRFVAEPMQLAPTAQTNQPALPSANGNHGSNSASDIAARDTTPLPSDDDAVVESTLSPSANDNGHIVQDTRLLPTDDDAVVEGTLTPSTNGSSSPGVNSPQPDNLITAKGTAPIQE